MKKICTLLLLMAAFVTVQLEAQQTIGLIDMEVIIQKSKRGRQLATSLEDSKAKKEEKLKELQDAYREKEKEMQTKAAGNSEAASKLLFELQKLEADIYRTRQSMGRVMDKAKVTKTKKLEEAIQPIVARLAAEKGIQLVLSTDQAAGIFYYHPSIDLTDAVIAELDEGPPE